MSFEPCGECRRHVRVGASACPFCGAAGRSVPAKTRMLGRISRAAVFASATSACWTGSTPPAQTTTVSNKVEAPATAGIISGRVVDASTKQAMAGVVVEVYPVKGGDARTVTTDANGRYQLTLEPGDYQVIFRGPQQNPRMAPYPNNVKIEAGQTLTLDNSYEPFDPSNIPMPYGAPPARRRVV